MKLVVSFSGGKTSAYMCYWIINNLKMFYDEIIFIFANTGQENEETYIFINNCDKFFNLNLVWVEAVVFPELGTGNGFKRVTFKTADRTGLVFETYIAKHGIPNQSFPKCTNELKLVPIRKYLRSIGLRNGKYHTAIGIRADEQGRRNSNWLKEGILYPLIDMQPTTKEEINEFWSNQPFNLSLHEHQGNCKWCWKKSKRKLLTLAVDSPEVFNFPIKMEELYSFAGPWPKTATNHPGRKFFRGNRTALELIEESKLPFERYKPDYFPDNFSNEFDSEESCSGSCEIL